jgi:outer membrane protein assembly factor BamB
VKRALIGLAALLLVFVGAGAAYVLYKRSQGGNIRGSSTAEFTFSTEQRTTRPHRHAARQVVAWPMYGFDEQRTRVGSSKFRPPYRKSWTYRGKSLLEFPPSLGYGRLYFTNNSGTTTALEAKTGKRVWRRAEHRCTAASPAIAGGLVFQTFLNRPPCNQSGAGLTGLLVAFGAKKGKVVWRRVIGPSESSPLVVGHRVYVGDWRGKVYAFETRSGHLDWSRSTGGAVKGGLAYDNGRVFAGSYDHHVYAFRARSGKLVWSSSAQQRFGALANFYSTPALAYGRLYIGGTDGKVYSYGAADGHLEWSHGTGSYVYSSPAVWRRFVFAGSYDGTFYAFDAATGDVRWTFSGNGPISGSPTVLHGVVYFATLKERTYALSARRGTKVWTFADGKYSPVVADSKRLYLVGHTRIYAMVPRRNR